MPDQPPTPATDAVEALTQFLCEPPSRTPTRDEIQAQLRQASVNMPRLKRRIGDLFQRAKGQWRLEEARSKRLDMLTHLKSLVSIQPLARTKAQVQQVLQETFGANPQVAVLFSKFADSSEADLHSLLEDLALLDDVDDADEDGLPQQ